MPSASPSTNMPTPPSDQRRRRIPHCRAIVGRERTLALDDAARDIFCDGLNDVVGRRRLGEDHWPVACILHKAIGAPVARHRDMRDHIDPQPRRLAARDAAIELLEVARNFRVKRIERFVEEFEPRDFRIVQFDDNGAAFGGFDARLPHGLAQARRLLLRAGDWLVHDFPIPVPLPQISFSLEHDLSASCDHAMRCAASRRIAAPRPAPPRSGPAACIPRRPSQYNQAGRLPRVWRDNSVHPRQAPRAMARRRSAHGRPMAETSRIAGSGRLRQSAGGRNRTASSRSRAPTWSMISAACPARLRK